MKLENKIAVVTGAGQGIGEAIAKILAEHGAKVVVSDINEENCKKVAEEIGESRAVSIVCDVSDKDAVGNLFEKTIEKYGKLDILVNNAGIFPFVPFVDMKESDWDKVMDVNLKSIFFTSQVAAQLMEGGGKIVNISSIASFVGFEGLTHYCTSKSGMNGMVRALALELANKKINVNAVAPGAIDTPGAGSTGNDDAIQQTIAAIPWGRMGEGEDIANAVAFLASDMADYITGQVVVVDGGYTLR